MKIQSKKILGVFALVSIFGCRQSADLPKDIILLEKMPIVLADLQLAEAEVARLSISSYDSSKVAYQYLQQQILKKHNLDSATYRISYEAYSRHPEQMEQIYTATLKILEAKSDSLRKLQKEESTEANPPK